MLKFARFSPRASWRLCRNSGRRSRHWCEKSVRPKVSITETDNGLDIVVEGVRSTLTVMAASRGKLQRLA